MYSQYDQHMSDPELSPVSALAPAPTRQLLLVEDNPLFCEQLSDSVHQLGQGFEIREFSEGLPAQNHLRETQDSYDLVLVDLGLPDISGVEVIRSCRERFPDVPIVVISVVASETAVLNAIEAGANGYILKDESIEEIMQGIANVLQGIYPLSPRLARYLFKHLAENIERAGDQPEIRLSPRELETLQHLAKGLSYDQVASKMGVTLSTVQSNVRSLYRKLNVKSQSQAISKARDHKLL